MSYKVLNTEGERVIVDQIDPTIHKHLSGRDFNENDACINNPVVITEDNVEEIWGIIDESAKLNLQEAKEVYKEKFWEYPKGNPKLETLLKKIEEKG